MRARVVKMKCNFVFQNCFLCMLRVRLRWNPKYKFPHSFFLSIIWQLKSHIPTPATHNSIGHLSQQHSGNHHRATVLDVYVYVRKDMEILTLSLVVRISILRVFIFICVCVPYVCMCSKRPDEGTGFPWDWTYRQLWPIWCRCWEPN